MPEDNARDLVLPASGTVRVSIPPLYGADMPHVNKRSLIADESQSLPHHTHSPEPLRVGGVLHTWRLEEGPLLDGCLGPLVHRDVLSDPMPTGVVCGYEIIFSPGDGENFPSSVDVSLELTTGSHMIAKKTACLPENERVFNGRGFRVRIGAASRGGGLHFLPRQRARRPDADPGGGGRWPNSLRLRVFGGSNTNTRSQVSSMRDGPLSRSR